MLTTTATSTTRSKSPFPRFVMQTMELVRSLSTRDGVIRVMIETTAKTAVCFHAHWLISSGKTRSIERRVFVECKLNDNGMVNGVFMAKPFDPDATVFEYALSDLDLLAKDIQIYLCNGSLPE